MEKVNLIFGIKVEGEGNIKIDLLERTADDPSYQRPALIDPHFKEGKHDYYTVIEAWAAEDEDEDEAKPKQED